MNATTVLFDAGNTLVGLDYSAISAICAEHDVEATPEELETADGRIRHAIDAMLSEGKRSTEGRDTRTEIIRLFLGALENDGAVRCKPLVADLSERVSGLFRRPMPGAHATLAEFHARGYRLGVVSNSDGTVERVLGKLGLCEHLEVVIDSTVVGFEKPDPEIFRIALSRLGVGAGDAVYIGDLPSVDLVGARAAGLDPILVDPFDRFPAADSPRIRSLPELLDLLPVRPGGAARPPDSVSG